MNKKISAITMIVVFIFTSIGPICAWAGDNDFITWSRITQTQFTKEEYDNGVFGFPAAFTQKIIETFPSDGGYMVVNSSGTQESMKIALPNHGYDDKTLKYSAGIKWSTNRGTDSPVFSLFINDADGGFAGAIRIIGGSVCFANSTSYSGVYVSVPMDMSSDIEASLIFDPTNKTVTPAINGEPIGQIGTFNGKTSYSGGIPATFDISLWLNWSSGDYVCFKDLFIEKGYDPTQECDYKKLTSEEPEKITKNLTLSDALENGSSVSWESSKPSVIDNTGTVTRNDNDETVTLTANINYEGNEMKKKFKFVVLGKEKLENNFILEETNFNTEAPYYNFVDTGGTVGIQNGRLVLSKDNRNEISAEKYFVSNLSERPYTIKAPSVIFEQYLSSSGGFDYAKCYLRNEEDKVIAVCGFERMSINEYRFFCTNEGGESSISYTKGDELYVKFDINSDNNTYRIFVNNEEIDPDTEKKTLADAGVSSVRYEIEGVSGEMTIDNSALMIHESNIEKAKILADAANVRITDMTSSDADKITNNLTFTDEARFGSELIYESSDTSVIDNMGFVKRASSDRDVTVTVVVKNGNEKLTKSFDFVVKKTDAMNLAIGKSVTATGELNGYEAENAVDWVDSTQWRTDSEEKALTVNLGENKIFNSVLLKEPEPYGVNAFKIEISQNGRSWQNVYDGTTIGEEKTVDFEITSARFVRYTVTNTSTVESGLCEMGVYYHPDPETAVKLDFDDVQIPGDYTVTGDLEFISEGRYGSKIEWKSSAPEIILASGKLLKKPLSDTVITITATMSNGGIEKTKEFKRLVEGSKSSVNVGSGGGSGSGRVSGIKSIQVNTSDTNSNSGDANSTISKFTDVSSERWSYSYIKELSDLNIISGSDGCFRPADYVTREEFVKMLILSLDIEADGTCEFDDVEKGSWYEKYIITAIKNKIVNGVSKDKFGIGSFISRQDMAVMVVRAADSLNAKLKQGEAVIFDDSQDIADYAKDAVNLLGSIGILEGDNGKIFSQKNLTREQAAKVLCIFRKELAK